MNEQELQVLQDLKNELAKCQGTFEERDDPKEVYTSFKRMIADYIEDENHLKSIKSILAAEHDTMPDYIINIKPNNNGGLEYTVINKYPATYKIIDIDSSQPVEEVKHTITKDVTRVGVVLTSMIDGVLHFQTMNAFGLGDKISFPVRKCDDGQTAVEGLYQGLAEGLSIEPVNPRLIGQDKKGYDYNDSTVYAYDYMYLIEKWDGRIMSNNPEIYNFKWVPASELYARHKSDPDSMTKLTQKCLTTLKLMGYE